MKNLVTLLLIVCPLVSSSQQYSNFQLINGHVYYIRVYEAPGQSQDSLFRQLHAFLPLVPYVSDVRAYGQGFSGAISHMRIFNTALIHSLHDTMFGNIVVQVENEKYRVIIKDIILSDEAYEQEETSVIDFTIAMSKGNPATREPTEFTDGPSRTRLMTKLDQYFADIFSITSRSLDDEW